LREVQEQNGIRCRPLLVDIIVDLIYHSLAASFILKGWNTAWSMITL